MNQQLHIAPATLSQYAFMAIPLAFAGLPLYVHVPDFYATTVGLSLGSIGLIILMVRALDAIQDPFIGYLSDRYPHHRFHVIIFALILLGLGFLLLFHPGQTNNLAQLAVGLFIATTAYSILAINLNALGSLWSREPSEKNRITAWREGFGLIGIIIAASLPGFFNFQLYSYLLVLLLIPTLLIFYTWYKKQSSLLCRTPNKEKPNGSGYALLKSSPNRTFFAIYFLSMLASAIPAVLVIFFIRDYLGAEEYTGLFLILYFLSGALGMPIWLSLAKRYSRTIAWLLAMILAVITFIWAYSLEPGSLFAYGAICFLSGLALGGELALPPAILSSLIDQQKQTTDTSLMFSVLTFISKAALALGSGLGFLLLGSIPSMPATFFSYDALEALSFTYALLPCLLKILAVIGLFTWIHLSKKRDDHAYSINPSSTHRGHHGS